MMFQLFDHMGYLWSKVDELSGIYDFGLGKHKFWLDLFVSVQYTC